MMAVAGNKAQTLGGLFGAQVPPRWRDCKVSALTLDSRQVGPGCVFVALPGAAGRHGLDFAGQAIAAGAAAIVYEPRSDDVAVAHTGKLPWIGIPGLRAQLGVAAARFYGAPSERLQVAGVTGTNAKTSVVRLIGGACSLLHIRCGMSGTLGAGLPGALRASELTTPDAITLQANLAEFVAGGATHAAIEVSSHGLDQQRVAGVRFDTAVFTNLSRDHLDYHGSMQAYLEAKQRLFATPGLRHAVINADDPAGATLAAGFTGRKTLVGRTSARAADTLRIDEVRASARGLRVRLQTAGDSVEIDSALLGDFNASNLALACAVLCGWDVMLADACRALGKLDAAPGRMEAFGGGARPLVVVDYAHTPDALDNALRALRAHCRGRLVVVFGCGGERDPGKRPLMGEIAARRADRVVVTDDNPRNEDPRRIIDAIVAGTGNATHVRAIPGRREAIDVAISEAVAGDIVLLAGKGHEDYQIVGGQRLQASDRALALERVGVRQ